LPGLPAHQRQVSGRRRRIAWCPRRPPEGGDRSFAAPSRGSRKNEHPLNRIINIDEDAEGIVINTTDIYVPRRIGEAVKRAFHGSLKEDFDEGG
jgi:hypothetical protein